MRGEMLYAEGRHPADRSGLARRARLHSLVGPPRNGLCFAPGLRSSRRLSMRWFLRRHARRHSNRRLSHRRRASRRNSHSSRRDSRLQLPPPPPIPPPRRAFALPTSAALALVPHAPERSSSQALVPSGPPAQRACIHGAPTRLPMEEAESQLKEEASLWLQECEVDLPHSAIGLVISAVQQDFPDVWARAAGNGLGVPRDLQDALRRLAQKAQPPEPPRPRRRRRPRLPPPPLAGLCRQRSDSGRSRAPSSDDMADAEALPSPPVRPRRSARAHQRTCAVLDVLGRSCGGARGAMTLLCSRSAVPQPQHQRYALACHAPHPVSGVAAGALCMSLYCRRRTIEMRQRASHGRGRARGRGNHGWGTHFWSCSANNPTAVGGVAVLFRAGAEVEDAARVAELAGKFLLVSFRHAGHVYAVASVYAPTYRDERCQFFAEQLLPLLSPFEHPLLLGGDFNCVADEFDVMGGGAASLAARQVGYWGGLQLVEDRMRLVDVFRERHPDTREVTHIVHTSAARLDRWLITRHLLPRVWASDVGVGADQLPGDHRPVFLNLHAGPQGPALGRGPWRFDLSLLKSPAFLEEARATILAFDASLGPDCSQSQGVRWDTLKGRLRDVAKCHMLGRARCRAAQEKALSRAVREALALCLAHPDQMAAPGAGGGARGPPGLGRGGCHSGGPPRTCPLADAW